MTQGMSECLERQKGVLTPLTHLSTHSALSIPPIHPPIHLAIHLSVRPLTYPSVCSSSLPSVSLPPATYLPFICPPIRPPIRASICSATTRPPISLSIYPSTCVSVCPSIHPLIQPASWYSLRVSSVPDPTLDKWRHNSEMYIDHPRGLTAWHRRRTSSRVTRSGAVRSNGTRAGLHICKISLLAPGFHFWGMNRV